MTLSEKLRRDAESLDSDVFAGTLSGWHLQVAKRMREAADALDARQAPAHEHRFRDYVVCAICGQTEAAAMRMCHHCDEVGHGERCRHCLRVRQADALDARQAPAETACGAVSPDANRPERCELPRGHAGDHEAFGGAQMVARWQAPAEPPKKIGESMGLSENLIVVPKPAEPPADPSTETHHGDTRMRMTLSDYVDKRIAELLTEHGPVVEPSQYDYDMEVGAAIRELRLIADALDARQAPADRIDPGGCGHVTERDGKRWTCLQDRGHSGPHTGPDYAPLPADPPASPPADTAALLRKLALWIRTPGNITPHDAIDECARLLENNAAALTAGASPEEQDADDCCEGCNAPFTDAEARYVTLDDVHLCRRCYESAPSAARSAGEDQ